MGQLIEMPSVGGVLTSPVRLLLRDEKTRSLFREVHALSDASFEGVQRPPESVLRTAYLNGDVFVKQWDSYLVSFALVTERNSLPFLWSLAVDRMYRGQGVGSQVLEVIRGHYADRPSIELTCNVDNPAQMLYFRNGYKVTSVLKKYYGQEDGLLMRLDMPLTAA